MSASVFYRVIHIFSRNPLKLYTGIVGLFTLFFQYIHKRAQVMHHYCAQLVDNRKKAIHILKKQISDPIHST